MSLGFYHNPSIWFSNNFEDDHLLLFRGQMPSERFEQILRSRQFDDLIINISKDGFFSFDFSDWPINFLPQKDNDFQADTQRQKQQCEIMNAFLFCFYSILSSRKPIAMMRVENTKILGDGVSGSGQSDDVMRVINSRHMKVPQIRLPFIPEHVLDLTLELFGDLYKKSKKDKQLLTIIQIFLSSFVNHVNFNFDEALLLAWQLIETFIDKEWGKYLDVQLVKGDRRKKLTSGRDYPVSVKIEILSFGGNISNEIYEKLSRIRQIRNGWIHGLSTKKTISYSDSYEAIRLAEFFFRRTYEFDSSFPIAGLSIVGGGQHTQQLSNIPKFIPPARYIYFNKYVHLQTLHDEILKAGVSLASGIEYSPPKGGIPIRIDIPSEADEIVKNIIEHHDAAFFRLDEAHTILLGKYRLDEIRNQNYVRRHNDDFAIITVELPHTSKNEIILLVNGKHIKLSLKDRKGLLTVSAKDADEGKIIVSVKGHPCDPLEITVVD